MGIIATEKRNAKLAFRNARNDFNVRGITLTVAEAKALQVQMIEAEIFGQRTHDAIESWVCPKARQAAYNRHVARVTAM